jgi:hypothetical protein
MPGLWANFVAETEGQFSLSQIHSLYAAKKLSEDYSILVDSYGGPLFRRQIKKFIEPSIDTNKDIASQILRYELTPLSTSELIKAEIREEIIKVSLDALRKYYSKIEYIDNIGDKFDMFYADQTASLRDSVLNNLQLNYTGIRQPLMDYRAITAVSRIPGAFRRHEGIHKYIIRHTFPKFENFSMDYSGYPVPYKGFSVFRYLPVGMDRLLKKVSRTVPFLKGISLRRPPMDNRSILQPRLAFAKEILLNPHPIYDGIVDLVALEKTISKLESGNFESGTAILQLLTFRLFLDCFF